MKSIGKLPGIITAVCLLVSSMAAFPAYAAEDSQIVLPEGVGEIELALDLTSMDDFDTFNGNQPGEWSISEGHLRVDGGSGNKVIVKDQEFSDFAYEADITVEKQADLPDQTSAQGGILFRVSNPLDSVADGYDGYYFCIDAKNDKVMLGKSKGTIWTEIASKKMTVEFGKPYHVMVTAYGDHITCYVDYNGENYAKLDVKDSEFTSGSVGMRNWLSHVSYKNAAVRNYTETQLSAEDSYTNPILNMCADPDILYYKGTYYLYPTNAGDENDDQGIKVYTSTDLVHWTDKGWAFKKGDGWGDSNFWAPDTIERDGTFYMYYVANEELCVATSDSPLGPYTQDVKEPMHSDVKEIDAHVFFDEATGKYYIYFVRFTNGNVIWGAELNDDMKTIKEDTLTKIVEADQGWDQDMGNINEGPFMITKDGKYYLTYSGSHFQSIQYGSGYAVSDHPLGPFEKYSNNPIMQSNSLAHGTGHHCITTSPDGTEMFMVYHSHHDLSTTEPRQLCIDRLQFTTDEDGNTVLEVKGPTVTPQALPSGAVDANNFIEVVEDDFTDITAENGTAAEEWNLPEQIDIRTSKGDAETTYAAGIEWNTDSCGYDPDNPEEQSLKVRGKIVLPEGISNLGNIPLDISIGVTVKAQEIPVTDKSALQEAADAAGKLVEKDYTADSWESLQQALSHAEILLASKDADQTAVDNALEALNQAVAGLSPKVEKPEGGNAESAPEKDDNTTSPVSNAQNYDQPDKPQKNAGSDTVKSPQTGVNSSVPAVGIIMFLSVVTAIGIICIRMKKQK